MPVRASRSVTLLAYLLPAPNTRTTKSIHWYNQIYCRKCIHLFPKGKQTPEWKSNSLRLEIRIFGRYKKKKKTMPNEVHQAHTVYNIVIQMPDTQKCIKHFSLSSLVQIRSGFRASTVWLTCKNSISKLPTIQCELWSRIVHKHTCPPSTVMNACVFSSFSWWDWICKTREFCTLENGDHAVRMHTRRRFECTKKNGWKRLYCHCYGHSFLIGHLAGKMQQTDQTWQSFSIQTLKLWTD